MNQYRAWPDRELIAQDGIIVGSNQTEEWLLPWWWKHYNRHNDFPVTFVDFGLSSPMKKWCQERGELCPLFIPDFFVSEKEEMDPTHFSRWAKTCGTHFWHKRAAWFKKPAACLQSPYRRSLWLDLDCEVRGCLAPLFAACDSPAGFALANYWETGDPQGYNAGVIAFRHKHPLIAEWANGALDRNREFGGDQDLLIALLQTGGWPIHHLDPLHNWSRTFGDNPNALILHWHGDAGKAIIANELLIANLNDTFSPQ